MKVKLLYLVLFCCQLIFGCTSKPINNCCDSSSSPQLLNCSEVLQKETRKYSKNLLSQINYLSDLKDYEYDYQYRVGSIEGTYKAFGLSGNYGNEKEHIRDYKLIVEQNQFLKVIENEQTENINPLAYNAYIKCIESNRNNSNDNVLFANEYSNNVQSFEIQYGLPCCSKDESKTVTFHFTNCLDSTNGQDYSANIKRGEIKFIRLFKTKGIEVIPSVYVSNNNNRFQIGKNAKYNIIDTKLITGNEIYWNKKSIKLDTSNSQNIYTYFFSKNNIDTVSNYLLNFYVSGFFDIYSSKEGNERNGRFKIKIYLNDSLVKPYDITTANSNNNRYIEFVKTDTYNFTKQDITRCLQNNKYNGLEVKINFEDFYGSYEPYDFFLQVGSNISLIKQNY